MPSVNVQITHLGPVVETYIGVSMPLRAVMESKGFAVPEPVICRLLIDTGASGTCIDPWVFTQLQLKPRGKIEIHTPSTNADYAHVCNQYDVSLVMPHPAINRIFAAIPVIESSLAHQGIDGLLGRDILTYCLFIYNGELGIYTLSF